MYVMSVHMCATYVESEEALELEMDVSHYEN